CAAIYTDAIDTERAPNGMLTEDVWNTTSSLEYQPYSYSKTLAEKEAWEMTKAQNRWDLVVMNPSFVMGPPLNPKTATSESINLLKQLGNGDMKMGAPKMGVGVIDVRDLAEAHFRGGYTPEANGRNIISAHNSDFLELGKILNKNFGNDYALPHKPIPKWLLMIVGPFANKLFTRRYIKNNVNHTWTADNSKAKKELGLNYRSLEESMVDGFQAMIDSGAFNK
ncbi:MAG: diaminohydroxyphosphoribosylaminopyrimidine deaminase, partial [Schleiferiaceae bacterium]|nr:diaminohydroxyphosphoribosylaminopyrimidine deaminase [Schleiferiaceae bacterium]